MTVTTRDIDILVRTVYGEARGESALGKLAVAWVVVNRAREYRVGLGEACRATAAARGRAEASKVVHRPVNVLGLRYASTIYTGIRRGSF